jgi:DNA-binding IclR family transcriptional regulator
LGKSTDEWDTRRRVAAEPEKRDALSGTLERGLAILEFFAASGEASAGAVAGALGLSRSATYRLVDALRERGYLEVSPASERLRLGVRAVELGMAALSGMDVARLAPPYLRELVRATSETVFLAVMDGDAMVYVYKEEGPRAVTMRSQIGSRRPLHSTALGKAYMSALPEDERRAMIGRLDLRRLTENTITDPGRLEAEVLLTAGRGYAVDNVEGEEEVACFAAPVLDHRRLPVAAISIAGPAERTLPNEGTMGPLVMQTAAALSRRLGYIASSVEGGSLPRA